MKNQDAIMAYYLGGSPPQDPPRADVVSNHNGYPHRRNLMDELDYNRARIADDPESFERSLNVLMAVLS